MKRIYYYFPVYFLLVGFGLLVQQVQAQSRPRLVVGITVDQMRWDFLYRFQHRWHENGGFKRMMQKGFNCNNTYINFTPTYTACGHAGIYTGSVPAIHGITGNDWWDNNLQRTVYCTEDNTVGTIGSSNVTAGRMSPVNMFTTTICDELKLATNFRSKTIGIAIKDRGGILPAGHSANAAYWYDSREGAWITSSYYMQELPGWVKGFGTKARVDSMYEVGWNTLYPLETYTQSVADPRTYELRTFGTANRHFPYDLKPFAGVNYSIITGTPHGNSLTTAFSKAAIIGEQLGADSITDFLAISYSSPDMIGHAFGPNSKEIEDCYLRLDLELGAFLDFLDKQVGKDEYLVFLSADHGAAHVPGFLKENKLPGGLIDGDKFNEQLNAEMKSQFGIENLSLGLINFQVVLNIPAINKAKNVREEEVSVRMISWLEKQAGILRAVRLDEVRKSTLEKTLADRITNGYYPARNGHIQVIFKPGYLEGFLNGGTTHGVWYPYDAHIPLLWYGWKIPAGQSSRTMAMTDIAPTLAALLQIQEPNGSVGNVIEELFFDTQKGKKKNDN